MCLDLDWIVIIGGTCLVVGGCIGFIVFGLMALSKSSGGWN